MKRAKDLPSAAERAQKEQRLKQRGLPAAAAARIYKGRTRAQAVHELIAWLRANDN